MRTLIKNGNVYKDGRFVDCDIVVTENDLIFDIAEYDEVIDATGLTVLPGLIDAHQHLREPGFEYKETIKTGSYAAAKGGFTTIMAMPNLKPAPDCEENIKKEIEIIKRDAIINVIPYATLTIGQSGRGENCDYKSLRKYTNIFSDDGKGVQLQETMSKAMQQIKEIDGIVVAHCEDESLLDGGYVHEGAWAKEHGYKGISSASEYKQVERDLQLAYETGCQYHVCHVSTKESVEAIRKYKAMGARVSGEVTPHHLLLADQDITEDNGRFKMNPPLRTIEDRKALVEGLIDGTLEIVSTDHAPHSALEKGKGLAKSAMGTVGSESAFPLLYTYLVKKGIITLEKLVEVMSERPNELFHVNARKSDLVIVDLNRSEVISKENIVSMGKATPFEGWEVYGLPVYTIVAGKVVYRR